MYLERVVSREGKEIEDIIIQIYSNSYAKVYTAKRSNFARFFKRLFSWETGNKLAKHYKTDDNDKLHNLIVL